MTWKFKKNAEPQGSGDFWYDLKAFTFSILKIALLFAFLFHVYAAIVSALSGKTEIAGEYGFRALLIIVPLVLISLWRLMQKD